MEPFKWQEFRSESKFPTIGCIYGEYTALVEKTVPDALGNNRKWKVARKNIWLAGGRTLGSENAYDACEAIILIDMRHREPLIRQER